VKIVHLNLKSVISRLVSIFLLFLLYSYTIPILVIAASNNVTYDTLDYVYPSDIGYFNVTKYGANGNDTADDTAAIQAAMYDAMDHGYDGHRGATVYFPAGTYYVRKTLFWKERGGNWRAYLRFEGQNKKNTVIRLVDNAPGFQNASWPVAVNDQTLPNCPGVIVVGDAANVNSHGGAGEAGYINDIWNLTVDTGKGNPGAIGIDWQASNRASIKNVNIVSEDGRGRAGLNIARNGSLGGGVGPAYVENLGIYGFDYGIYARAIRNTGTLSREVGVTFEFINFEHQNVAGVVIGGFPNWFRIVSSNNSVPVFKHNDNGGLLVTDANLIGGSPSNSAIENGAVNHQGVMFFRNITTSDYKSALSSGGGQNIAEYAFPTPKDPGMVSLNLQAPRTPSFWDGNLNHWANIADYGRACANPWANSNITSCAQAALDSGKPVVYFPFGHYTISSTLRLRNSNLRLVYGANSKINFHGAIFSNDENGPNPVEVRLFYDRNYGGLQQNGSAPLVGVSNFFGPILNVTGNGTGDIYLEEGDMTNVTLHANQHLYIRQYDVEVGSSLHSRINGGMVWVFGAKTEGGGQIYDVTNSTVEILGAFGTAAHSTTNPLAEFTNSKFSIAGLTYNPGTWSSTIAVNGQSVVSSGGWAGGRGVGLYSGVTGTPARPIPPPVGGGTPPGTPWRDRTTPASRPVAK
jgi:hypothetical protein